MEEAIKLISETIEKLELQLLSDEQLVEEIKERRIATLNKIDILKDIKLKLDLKNN